MYNVYIMLVLHGNLVYRLNKRVTKRAATLADKFLGDTNIFNVYFLNHSS